MKSRCCIFRFMASHHHHAKPTFARSPAAQSSSQSAAGGICNPRPFDWRCIQYIHSRRDRRGRHHPHFHLATFPPPSSAPPPPARAPLPYSVARARTAISTYRSRSAQGVSDTWIGRGASVAAHYSAERGAAAAVMESGTGEAGCGEEQDG